MAAPRTIPLAIGCYVITHTATGKVIIGISKNVYAQQKILEARLKKQEHSNNALQDLYDADPRITFEVFEAPTLQAADQIWIDKVVVYQEQGLLINSRAKNASMPTPKHRSQIRRAEALVA